MASNGKLKVNTLRFDKNATGDSEVKLGDNLADALSVEQGSTSYLKFVTTNSGEKVVVGQRLVVTDGVTSGTERVVGGLASASTAASTAVTGATETETNFDTSYTIPANTLKAGSVIRVRAQGIATATTGSETYDLLLKIGSTTVASKASIDAANSDIFYFDFVINVRTAGASGTFVAAGVIGTGASGSATAAAYNKASTAIDTTVSNVIAIAIDRQATATDSDSARLDILDVWID